LSPTKPSNGADQATRIARIQELGTQRQWDDYHHALDGMLAAPSLVFGPAFCRAVNRTPDPARRRELLERIALRMSRKTGAFSAAGTETYLAVLAALGREDDLARIRVELAPLLSSDAATYYDRRDAVRRDAQLSYSQVWCLGLSRTGTTSLHQYLCKAGILSAHFLNPFEHRLIDRTDARVFDAVSDTSAVHIARRHGIPTGVRIIFQSREFRTWRPSFLRHFNALFATEDADFAALKDMFHSREIFAWGEPWCEIHEDLYFRHNTLKQAFEAHRDWIVGVAVNSEGRFLTLELEEQKKSEKLAQFLGIEPGIQFPRLNVGHDDDG
jgi:hypothetical protein